MKIKLEKGRSLAEFDFPESRIIDTLMGKDVPALDHSSVAKIIRQGIEQTAPKDLNEKKIALLIPDDTRLWARGDLFVPEIIRSLEVNGADPEKICIIIALGTHAPISEQEFAPLCGTETLGRIKVINSAGLNREDLVHIGTTSRSTPVSVTKAAWEADHIIIFGGLLHHMLAGYGGGRKYILPGIAGEEAIQHNHSLAMGHDGLALPTVTQGELAQNPVSLDMAEAAALFLREKTCTYAAVAVNGQGQIFYADAGELDPTFDKGCAALDQACCTDVDLPGDFALFSAGGHRTDTQLYQSTKALFNAVNVVKKGGRLIFVAGCSQGTGNPEFEQALVQYRKEPSALGRKLTQEFRMPAYVAFRVMDLLHNYTIFLVSDLGEELTTKLGFTYLDPHSELEDILKGKGYIIPFAENILPRYIPQTG